MLKLTIEGLAAKVSRLEKRNKKLSKRIARMEQEEKNEMQQIKQEKVQKDDELLDTSEVLKILGISYNTLRAIIEKKLILPIRINQRRVRYSKRAIYAYIAAQSH